MSDEPINPRLAAIRAADALQSLSDYSAALRDAARERYSYLVSVPGQPDATVTIEPVGEPAMIETYDDGTWIVNGEQWEGD